MSKQRIFMTGASGYIGSVVTELAIARGYEVYALSRSKTSDAKLTKLGAIPVRGDLHAFDALRQQSTEADIVLHLADSFTDNFHRDYTEVVRIDADAVAAMGAGLEGSNKPFVATSGSLVVAPAGVETDESSPISDKPLNGRIACERNAMSLSKKGVRVSVIRLAPFVYGRGGSGIKLFMTMLANAGEVGYVGNGDIQTSAVHVDDAAALYLLAAEKARTGEIFNGVSGQVKFRDLAEAEGEVLNLPVHSVAYEDALSRWGQFFARFLSTENWSSGEKAKRVLGWEPKEAGIIDDLKTGSYVAIAESLKVA
ncbi:uncharacterized protein K452DRAFT_287479 [Aplosporella prunicola CBS 121167]|uniref:NAD-dependent epimerase/dehydratase domain-containing protein n=1 Tax=Aplosporella prunicola CBS 121167 TaxID=1176127 RepID=A0A6A6BFC4_9PEZI|nr:uncharacterized protein K452DRAFT_287479 [Aplosporella prunicola CBS 121167]KAF2142258.1 hypothetical protein K452DRAFT_287479 [Aplosporella prunicola CBS 121167]